MTVEDRLRDALRAEAETVRPEDDRWTTIESRAVVARRRRLVRWSGLSVVGVAAVVALVLGLVQVLDTDEIGQKVRVGDEPPSPSTVPTTVTTAAPTPTPTADFDAVWDRSFADPVEAARVFARDYLKMPAPSVGAFAEGEPRAGEVAVRPKPGRGPTTTVSLRQLDPASSNWFVTSASSPNLRLSSPQPGAAITSPVTLKGESTAFEGTVNVQVRQQEIVIGRAFYTGGGNGDFAPFAAAVAFEAATNVKRGAVELLTYSAEDGSVQEATVSRVTFGVPADPDPPSAPQPQGLPDHVVARSDSRIEYVKSGVSTFTDMARGELKVRRVAMGRAGDIWVERADANGCRREIAEATDPNNPAAGGSPEFTAGHVFAYTRSTSTGDTCKHDEIALGEKAWSYRDAKALSLSITEIAPSPDGRYIAYILQAEDGRVVKLFDTKEHSSLEKATDVLPPKDQPNAVPVGVGFNRGNLVVDYLNVGMTVARVKIVAQRFAFRWGYVLWVNQGGVGSWRIGSGAGGNPDPGDAVDVDF